jgi:hypothetical protein
VIRSLYSHATGHSTDPGSNSKIKITFLRDCDNGGDKSQPAAISKRTTDFISQATRSIHIAIYDFHHSSNATHNVGNSLVMKYPKMADLYAHYIGTLIKEYKTM